MEGLLKQALRCGISMAEFWDLTPRETLMEIQAANWRDERQQEQNLIQAWCMAVLIRSEKLPFLKQLLNSAPAKPLKGKELQERQQEFKDMTANVNIDKLVKRINGNKHE